jgi:phospholipid/cholesterol/gamma-HCH transport system substrate-binding protein
MATKMLRGQTGRVYGVVFLLLCLLFVWFTYAVFTKKFSDYEEVTLLSDKIGLSLPTRADVKIRGVLVGEVLGTTTDGEQAKLTLGIYPDKASSIPADVSAAILPKTLFGEKYVALEVPADPSSRSIQAGDTIRQSEVSIEVEKVVNDLFPLLRTLRPADLNYTLTAIANALEGRGEKIGQSFVTLDGYLKKMNPEVPALLDSLENLGKVSVTYRQVVPELTRMLRNTVKTTHTFESREDQVKALFDDVAAFSGTARQFLQENGTNMVTLARQGQTILPMVARYAPEFPCFLDGVVASIPRNEQAFRNKTLHIVLEVLPRQPRGYNVRDMPANADTRGPFPYCDLMYKAIDGAYNQENLIPPRVIPNIRDGVDYPIGKRVAVGDAVAGTGPERAVLDTALAPVLGVPVTEVPDLATLLLGPMAAGTQVSVR